MGAVALVREVLKSSSEAPALRSCSSAVSIATMGDVDYRHHAGLVIDAVDHRVGPAPGAEPITHWRKQPFADAVRASGQRARDEFIGSCRHSFRQCLTKGATDGGRGTQLVGILSLEGVWRLAVMAAGLGWEVRCSLVP